MTAPNRLLFASPHFYLDSSSGAAFSTRDILLLLGRYGWETYTLSGPNLDFRSEVEIEGLLNSRKIKFQRYPVKLSGADFTLHQFIDDSILSIAISPNCSNFADETTLLELYSFAFRSLKPDMLMTYGGPSHVMPMLRAARSLGIRTFFALHNLAYKGNLLFRDVDRILVPSEFSRQYYYNTLGLESMAIAPPMLLPPLEKSNPFDHKFLTFVNPSPEKGVYVFARIAERLARKRPDIPILLVEARGNLDSLKATGIDFSGIENIHRMKNTPNPNDFLSQTKLILIPSLCDETFCRVAAEAMRNGIIPLASDRGAIPETLGGSGVMFGIPEKYRPETRGIPEAEEIRPWIETVERLWDNHELYTTESSKCRLRAARWNDEILGGKYVDFFSS